MDLILLVIATLFMASALALAEPAQAPQSKPLNLPDFSSLSRPNKKTKAAFNVEIKDEGCTDKTEHNLKSGDLGYETCLANPRQPIKK